MDNHNARQNPQVAVGDVIELKKAHPCGANAWLVTGLGADIRLQCTGCKRHVMIARSDLARRYRTHLRHGA